jgi:hypothetical protein
MKYQELAVNKMAHYTRRNRGMVGAHALGFLHSLRRGRGRPPADRTTGKPDNKLTRKIQEQTAHRSLKDFRARQQAED